MLTWSDPVQGKYKNLIAFLLKLAVKLLLELDNSHVYSQQNVVNCAKEELEPLCVHMKAVSILDSLCIGKSICYRK